MDISKLEEKVQSGIEKGKDALANVASHLPFANFAKKDDYNFTVEIDLPGVKKPDIDISVDGNKLSVTAVRNFKKEVSEEDYYIQESFYGKIARSFILPDDIDQDSIDASLEDGRLYLNMKRAKETKPKSISIK